MTPPNLMEEASAPSDNASSDEAATDEGELKLKVKKRGGRDSSSEYDEDVRYASEDEEWAAPAVPEVEGDEVTDDVT